MTGIWGRVDVAYLRPMHARGPVGQTEREESAGFTGRFRALKVGRTSTERQERVAGAVGVREPRGLEFVRFIPESCCQRRNNLY